MEYKVFKFQHKIISVAPHLCCFSSSNFFSLLHLLFVKIMCGDSGEGKKHLARNFSGDLSAPPCLVTLNAGVRIAVVAAGGRHILALFQMKVRCGVGLWRGRTTWFGFSYPYGIFPSSCTLFRVSFFSSFRTERSSSVTKGSTSSEVRA
ncbi:prolycopene isomerase, chloroplastic [Iris pallida]|uniref:Prolycopene isomerase, chloroplastic n=1 Tax=Iris pallida TaxID=29817 RepID=A0AAX6EEI9_IRIPA|nr:prolycopene isomerase, chloroplastic [Iris pallida]KAJ6804347.1 prolycopene isomerase, chloroplastic [Iris pallida]KAJ6848729.1 prolycopene isomerase, chloroplastic [Iris pallida]